MQYSSPIPLHAATDPDLLTWLREMLGSSARAGLASGKMVQANRLKGVPR